VEDFISVGPKNGARYPDYHRLDIALSRNFKLGDMGIGGINFPFSMYITIKMYGIKNLNSTTITLQKPM